MDIQSNRQLWGVEFPVNGEWDAGVTPLHFQPPKSGRWTVRREANHFVVLFHRFDNGMETVLATFPPTEEGEINAKSCALAARDTQLFSTEKENNHVVPKNHHCRSPRSGS